MVSVFATQMRKEIRAVTRCSRRLRTVRPELARLGALQGPGPDDPGHLSPDDRQQLRLEPGIAREPRVIPPGRMGQGHETRMVGRTIHIAPPRDRFAQAFADNLRAKMPLLSILSDEQNELQIGQKRKHLLAPELGAFSALRQVAAFAVETRETEPHRHDRNRLRIVEDLFPDPEPAAQSHARWIGVGAPRSMHPDARSLTGDAEAGGGWGLGDRPRRMRPRRPASGGTRTQAG